MGVAENEPRLKQRKPTSSSTKSNNQPDAATAVNTAKKTAKKVEFAIENTLLQAWDVLEPWRRDNAYLLTGYRSTSNSYTGSIHSLTYLHNETVNIYTHLLGSIAAIITAVFCYNVIAPRYASATNTDVLVWGCFLGGAMLCLGMSATYHLLSNHSASVAKWGNKLDYTGIVCLIVGSYQPALYYGWYGKWRLMELYLGAIWVLGIGCLIVSWDERFRTPEWRAYRTLMFVGLGVSGIVPVVHGLLTDGYAALDQRMGLSWVLLQGFLYVFGAWLYVIRWPERAYPRTFDIWGSSHQLFHIFILFAAAAHLVGMARAFDYWHGGFMVLT